MEKYELKKCPCCGEEPELFGEGIAKKYFEDGNGNFVLLTLTDIL